MILFFKYKIVFSPEPKNSRNSVFLGTFYADLIILEIKEIIWLLYLTVDERISIALYYVIS